MAYSKRNDYLRVLNKMRSNYQNNGNAMINTMDDSTNVGEELSSFAYMNMPTPSIPENQNSDIEDYKKSRDGWQRAMDTGEEFLSNVSEGVFNVVDDVGDFLIGIAGEIGSWFKADTQWAEDAISYDWATQVHESTMVFNPFDILSGDVFHKEYYDDLSKIGSVEGANELKARRHAGSFVSDTSESFQNTYNGITVGVGELLPSLALAYFTGGASLGVQVAAQGGLALAKAGGQGTESALKDGADFHGAVGYGAIKGTISGAITAATVGIGGTVVAKGGQGIVSKGAQKIGEKVGTVFSNSATAEVIAGKTTEIFMRAGIDATSAGAQSLLDPVLKQVTYDSEAIQKAYGSSEAIQNTLANMGNAMVQAGITSAILSTGKEVASGIKAKSFDGYKENYFVNKLTSSDAIKAKKYTEEYDNLCKEYYEKSGLNTGNLLSEDEFIKLSMEYSSKIEKLSSKYKVNEIFKRATDGNTYEGTTAEKYAQSIGAVKTQIGDSLRSRAVNNTLPKAIAYDYIKKSGWTNSNSTETNSNGNSTFTSSDGVLKLSYNESTGESVLTTPYNPNSPIPLIENKSSGDVSVLIQTPNQAIAMISTLKSNGTKQLPSTFVYNDETYQLTTKTLQRIVAKEENKDNELFGLEDGETALKYLDNNYTEEELRHLNNSKSQVITNGEELKEYVYNAINNPENVKIKALVGRITTKTVSSLKKDTGIDFSNFSLAYDKDNIRHIIKRHIDNSNENMPIEYSDLFKFPYIMENYDNATVNKNNNTLVVQKWVSDKFQLVAEYSMKSKNLVLKSLYKIKKRKNKSLPVVHDSNESLLGTPLTQSGVSSSSNNSISQNGSNNAIKNDSVENSGDLAYNKDNERGERSNGFRRLQEESRRLFTTNSQQERVSTLDDSLYTRIRRILSREIRYFNSRNSNTTRLLENTNNFKIYDGIDGTLFHDCFEIARTYLKNGELVELHDNYDDCTCYLSDDGLSGFAITKNGDLISVFNLSNEKGFLRAIAPTVVKRAKTLDCYVSPKQNLQGMYSAKFGFKTASIMDYNMDYDHDNIATNHNNPQVAFMVNTEKNVLTRHFNKDQYDEAKAYQLSYVNNGKVKSDTTPAGHDTSLVKDSANLRKQKVYTLKTTGGILKNVLTNLKDKFPDGVEIKLSGSKADIIRKTFEEINLSKDEDSVVNNLVDTILNGKISIKDGNDVIEYNISDVATQKIITDLRKAIKGLIAHKGDQSAMSKFVDKYLSTVDRLTGKIKELRTRTEYVIAAKKKIDSIKKKIENSKSMTATGDMVIEEIGMINNLIKGIKLSATKKGISPLSVTHFVENLKGYTTTLFKESLLGYNSDFKAIADYFEEKFVNGVFPNRELTLEETEMFLKGLSYINGMAKELASEKTKQMIEMVKSVNKSTRVLHDEVITKGYSIIERATDSAVGAPSFFAGILGREHEFTKLITTEYMDAYNNKLGASIKFLKLIKEKIPKQVGMSYRKFEKSIKKIIKYKGNKLRLGEALDIYCTLNANEEAFDVGFELYSEKTKTTKVIKISKEEFEEFSNLISELVRKYADEVCKTAYNGEFKDYLAGKYQEFTGVPLTLTDNYYPQQRGRLNNSGLESLSSNDRGFLTTANTSIIKKRTGSKSPFKVVGFSNRLNEYINKISYYGEFTKYVDKYRIILNKKIDGLSLNNMFDAIVPNWNKGTTSWSSYLSDIILERTFYNDGLFGKAFSRAASATLGTNLSSAAKQFLSVFTMANYSGLGDWAKTLFKGITNLGQWKRISQIIQEEQPYFVQRWENAEALRSETGASSVPKWIKAFGFLMELNDKAVIITHGWSLAQYLAKEQGAGEYWSPENNKVAAKILTDIVLTTQSNSQPMYMSKLRSGYLSSLAKHTFGIFGSDNQIKTEQCKKVFNQATKAKRRADAYEKAMNEATIEEDKEFYKKEFEKANKETKQWFKSGTTLLTSLFLGGIGASIVKELFDRLLGRKEWNEFDEKEFTENVMLESFVNWLPYVGTIANAIENNTEVSLFTLDQMNNIITSISDLGEAISSGDGDKMRTELLELAMYLSQLTGFPAKNLYNIITGAIYQFDKEKAISIRAWTNGYSSSYIKSTYRNALEDNLTDKAKANLQVWSYMYSIQLDDKLSDEIVQLESDGYSATPKATMTYYNDDKGNKIELTKVQQQSFNNYYKEANTMVSSLLEISDYKTLDNETKAKMIKKIYDSYYDYAKIKLTGTTSTNKIVNLLSITNGRIGLSKFVIGVNALSNIEATKNKTRKELVLEKINKMSGYTKVEKLLLVYLCGFTLSDNNKTKLRQYLTQCGATLKDAKNLIN